MRITQKKKILSELKRRRGEWVSTRVLACKANSFSVYSRLSELRKDGYKISHRESRSPQRKGFYRLSLSHCRWNNYRRAKRILS